MKAAILIAGLALAGWPNRSGAEPQGAGCQILPTDAGLEELMSKLRNNADPSVEDDELQGEESAKVADGNVWRLKNRFERVRELNARAKALLRGCRGIEFFALDAEVDRLTEQAYGSVSRARLRALARGPGPRGIDHELKDLREQLRKIGHPEYLSKRREDLIRKHAREVQDTRSGAAQAFNNAARCTPRDLRSRLPPVRDQAHAGLCYAFVAADFASFATGQNISALGVAIADKLERNRQGGAPSASPDFQQGGQEYLAFERAKKNGFCLDGNFGNSTFDEKMVEDLGRTDEKDAELKSTRYTLLKNIEAVYAEPDRKAAMSRLLGDGPNGESCTEGSEALRRFFPGVKAQDLLAVAEKADPKSFIYSFYERFCASRSVKVNANLTQISVKPGSAEALEGIFGELDKEQMVGIGYGSNINYTSRPVAETDGHASSIVGRHFNAQTGKCELLLRNSWGANCKDFALNGSTYKCEAGHVWIPAEVVQAQMSDYTRFDLVPRD